MEAYFSASQFCYQVTETLLIPQCISSFRWDKIFARNTAAIQKGNLYGTIDIH